MSKGVVFKLYSKLSVFVILLVKQKQYTSVLFVLGCSFHLKKFLLSVELSVVSMRSIDSIDLYLIARIQLSAYPNRRCRITCK